MTPLQGWAPAIVTVVMAIFSAGLYAGTVRSLVGRVDRQDQRIDTVESRVAGTESSIQRIEGVREGMKEAQLIRGAL